MADGLANRRRRGGGGSDTGPTRPHREPDAGTGARAFVETFAARIERGAGLPAIERLGYPAETVQRQLADVKHLFVAGRPVPRVVLRLSGQGQ
ncbi:hypothetical protein ACFVWP_39065 [Streptomyces sp. NPDC058175]|uniref:hypothetical protein n=1 Tax=Streptomyces sp. NPDC058175 TaxID=3346367 RepID=UPI0036EE53C5